MSNKKDKKKSKKHKKNSLKNKNIFILILIVLITLVLIYILSPNVRLFIDEKILKKYVTQEDATEIFINAQNNPKILIYDKNIGVLERGELNIYNSSGEQINISEKLNISMGTPIAKTNEKHLVLVEKNGRKVSLINNNKIVWDRELDFNIHNANVNQNGYVVVMGSNNMYKSIVGVISNEGDELFIIYISSNIVIDAEISNDNKILAIAEVNYSKPIVESIIKYISIDKAIKEPNNSTIKSFKQNKLIIDIKFKGKDTLLAHFPREIYKYGKEEEKIYDISENVQFVDLGANKNIVVIEQVSDGIFSGEYQLTVLNDSGRAKAIYKIGKFVPKELKISNSHIAVNLGQEVVILTIDGWEKRKYNSNKEVREVILSDKICAILYKNSFHIVDI